MMEEFMRARFFRSGPGFSSYGPRPRYGDEMSEEQYQRMKQEMRENEAGEAEQRKMYRQEYMARADAAKARSEAKARAKKTEEEQKHMSKEQREKAERILQEKKWASLNATTPAEKQSTCLHSEFWPKEQQKKKFKCGACRQKRGPTGYKCPHCALLSCQGCLSALNEKRTAT
jgi:hypothetical protein